MEQMVEAGLKPEYWTVSGIIGLIPNSYHTKDIQMQVQILEDNIV